MPWLVVLPLLLALRVMPVTAALYDVETIFADLDGAKSIALDPLSGGSQGTAYMTINNRVRKLEIDARKASDLAGAAEPGLVIAKGGNARFDDPRGIAFDAKRLSLLVADHNNNLVRIIDIASGTAAVFAGSSEGKSGDQDGIGTGALFNKPWAIRIDASTDSALVIDTGGTKLRIRKIDLQTRTVTTELVTGTSGGTGRGIAVTTGGGTALLIDGTSLLRGTVFGIPPTLNFHSTVDPGCSATALATDGSTVLVACPDTIKKYDVALGFESLSANFSSTSDGACPVAGSLVPARC